MVKNSRGVMLKELWILGAPTIVEQLLQTMVGYVDTAMVGRLGAKASAAVGVTATVNWLFYGMMFAASLGLLSYIARFTGAGDEKSARRASAQGIWLLLFLGIPESILALAISPALPNWLGAAEEIREDASMYFFLVSLAMFFRCSIGNCFENITEPSGGIPLVIGSCPANPILFGAAKMRLGGERQISSSSFFENFFCNFNSAFSGKPVWFPILHVSARRTDGKHLYKVRAVQTTYPHHIEKAPNRVLFSVSKK